VHCPFCNHPETRVIDSRLAGDGEQVRRRRECLHCSDRFTTYETAELSLPRVVKRSGRREPFTEDKLRTGVLRALERRPVPTDAVEAALNKIEKRLLNRGEREVSSRLIGEWAMESLRELDQVAYIRFASVYLSFADLNAFRDLIDHLDKELTPEMRRQQISLLDNQRNDP